MRESERNTTLKVTEGFNEILFRKYFISGSFPHLYDKTKPEIDVVSVGKAYINPLS